MFLSGSVFFMGAWRKYEQKDVLKRVVLIMSERSFPQNPVASVLLREETHFFLKRRMSCRSAGTAFSLKSPRFR